MKKLKIQKNNTYIKLITLSKTHNKINLPTKLGTSKLFNYLEVKYNIIIILQKYGFILTKGLCKFLLRNLFKYV